MQRTTSKVQKMAVSAIFPAEDDETGATDQAG
jgi:hypothetical protein